MQDHISKDLRVVGCLSLVVIAALGLIALDYVLKPFTSYFAGKERIQDEAEVAVDEMRSKIYLSMTKTEVEAALGTDRYEGYIQNLYERGQHVSATQIHPDPENCWTYWAAHYDEDDYFFTLNFVQERLAHIQHTVSRRFTGWREAPTISSEDATTVWTLDVSGKPEYEVMEDKVELGMMPADVEDELGKPSGWTENWWTYVSGYHENVPYLKIEFTDGRVSKISREKRPGMDRGISPKRNK